MKTVFLFTSTCLVFILAIGAREYERVDSLRFEAMKQLEIAVRDNGRLTQENNKMVNRLNSYIYQIAVLQDEVFHLKEANQSLIQQAKTKPLCEIIDEEPVLPPQTTVIVETKVVRELPSFTVHTFLGYGVNGVSIKSDGTNVYGDPKKGMIGGFSLTTHPFRDSSPWNRISIGGGVIGAESVFFQTSFDF